MITRPAHQAEPLCRLIEAAGGHPYRFPLLEIHPPKGSLQEQKKQLDRLNEFDIAVFISPNAVEKAIELIQRRNGLPAHLKLATVGRGSANTMSQLLGHEPDICAPPPYNSAALLTNSGMQNLSDRNIIIFRGNGGNELLAETLRLRGARVEYCEVYRRTCPEIEPATQSWKKKRIGIITITSGSGLRNLVHLVKPADRQWLFQMPLVVIHPRLATLAGGLGFVQRPLVTKEASDSAIVDTINTWAIKQTNFLRHGD